MRKVRNKILGARARAHAPPLKLERHTKFLTRSRVTSRFVLSIIYDVAARFINISLGVTNSGTQLCAKNKSRLCVMKFI